MIEVAGQRYSLILLDTNALSEMLLSPHSWAHYIATKYMLSNTMPCYSAFTVVELFGRQELFGKYLEIFSAFPSVMLDGYESIFQKEMESYDSNQMPSPLLIAPWAIHESSLNAKERLRETLRRAGLAEKAARWKAKCPIILKGILDLRENYPPKGSSYTRNEIEQFVRLATLQQIRIRSSSFIEAVESRQKQINISKFPSVLTTSYVVFYKFYPDKRVPIASDIFDIIISSVLPYVDYVITEAQLCSFIRTIQERHKQLLQLSPISIAEARAEIQLEQQTSRQTSGNVNAGLCITWRWS